MRWATKISMETPHKADEFRYYAPAVTPKGKQTERVGYVIDLARRYWEAGFEVVGVAHSNGAIIATEAIRQSPAIWHSLHLIAPACASDCGAEGNGLNEAMERGRLGRAFIYTGDRDFVLRTIAPLGSFLGYGNLGYVGPQNMSTLARKSIDIIRTANDHNSYFQGPEEERIFSHVTQTEATPEA